MKTVLKTKEKERHGGRVNYKTKQKQNKQNKEKQQQPKTNIAARNNL